MKGTYILLVIILTGCSGSNKQDSKEDRKDTIVTHDTVITEKKITETNAEKSEPAKSKSPESPQTYSNERFKEVRLEKTGTNKFVVKGKAQIFEAQFSWVVEDGHEELKKGAAMTDAGAPEWGNFTFTVDVPKKRPSSTLHLILFESSAKDGSRQYELPVFLY
ncbi:MAG: Gmad2 immunoglobulin-like domain-containing protein [Ginsengibacter sp.]